MKAFLRKGLYLLPLIVFAVMFGMNVASIPSLSDDILYKYYYPEQPVKDVPHGVVKEHPVSGIHDITESIYHHYFNMNGRAPVHFAVQLFCGLWGTVPFGILSVAFLILFSIITCRIAGYDGLAGGGWLLLTPVFLLLVFFVEPNVWMSIASGINYLWSSALCLGFWLCLIKRENVQPYELAMLCFLSFIAGWSHEGIVIPLSVACLSYYIRNVRTFKKSQYIMLACWTVGAAFLVLAPGNFIRAGESVGWSFRSLFELSRLMHCFFVMCFLGLILLIKSRAETLSFVRDNVDMIFGIVGGIVFFSMIHNKPPRIAYGIELLSVVLSCKLLVCLLKKESVRRFVGISISMVALLGMAMWITCQHRSNEQIKDLVAQLENPAENDGIYIVKDVKCPGFLADYLIRCVNYSNPLYDEWSKKVLSWEYGKPVKCIVEAKDKLKKIPGNNSFYSWGSYWVSEEGFPGECHVRYHIDYTANLKYRLIRIVKRVLNKDIAGSQEGVYVFDNVQQAGNLYLTPMYMSTAGIIEEVNVPDYSSVKP